jgi:heme A synthase
LIGFIVHGMNGMFVIPALALVLLVVSFFAKVPRGVVWAAVLLVLIVVQVLLGIAHVPELAMLHGVNALLVFTVALVAGNAARTIATPAPEARTSSGAVT